MDLNGPKFACSPYDESCNGQALLFTSPFNSTKRMQHQPDGGPKTLATLLHSAPPAELSNIVIVRITY
jgi:hypothetical protein